MTGLFWAMKTNPSRRMKIQNFCCAEQQKSSIGYRYLIGLWMSKMLKLDVCLVIQNATSGYQTDLVLKAH